MSGHSKWHNIKIRKGAQDAKRGKAFAKLSREIMVAASLGGSDSSMNVRLKTAIEKAKEVSMPIANIERAVKKGSGELDGGNQLVEVVYEGYGPGGVALIIETMTDNRNRTAGEVRSTLTKHGGNLGEAGCVAWMFEQKGIILLEPGSADTEEVMLAAIECGAEDVTEDGDTLEIQTDPQQLYLVRTALEEAGYKIQDASLTMIPKNVVPLDLERARKTLNLMELLEDLEDVGNVYANFDIPDELMQELQSE
jgi:YebC/PmpR family DNA-binding regulatory protein